MVKAPPVRQFMTRIPVEAERCETVQQAARLMEQHQIRHLPVMSGSHLLGVVSQRDILSARLREGDKVDAQPLEHICKTNVLQVGPLTPVDQVAAKMLDQQVSSALVVDGGFVVGIFTTVDALRVIHDVFGGTAEP